MIFCTETLGCKVNQYETQAMAGALLARGHVEVAVGGGCDVCIINTCAVTGESARKSRQAVRRLKKLEPDALVAVCGCLSQLEPGDTAELGADLVGGSGDRLKFIGELEQLVLERSPKTVMDDPFDRRVFEELPPGGGDLRTRAFLKIQDGCDNFCAYCIIPYARGHVRSLPPDKAAEAARKLARDGYREIVITGIEISSYGKDLGGGTTLVGVVAEIGRAVGDDARSVRLRLGSLDPSAVTEEFCKRLSEIPNLCNHFHLSLQSGCSETLRRMGRRYPAQTAANAVALLRGSFPDCGITADLITGFPGETETEFEETLAFIKAARFSDMHIFPFSPRPGTRAADMTGQVEKRIRRERAGAAIRLAEEMALEFRLGQVGKTVGVLFERERDGAWAGHSENYMEVSVVRGGSRNSVHSVQITEVCGGLVWGEIF